MRWRIGRNTRRAVERTGTGGAGAAGSRPPRRRLFIIHNAVAGMRRRWLLRHVCRELEAAGAELTLVAADSLEMDVQLAADAAASGAYDAVVAAGGDSTVRGAGMGLCGSSTPLGIIPIGTGNVVAEEIRFRGRPRTVARHLLCGRTVPVYGGRANGSYFFSMAGAGFDARVLRRLNTRWKRRIGKFAYTWPVLAELSRTPRLFNAIIDGKSYQCSWLIIAKTSRYGGPFRLTSRQSLEDDGFHAVVINACSRIELIGVLAAIALGRLENHHNVRIIRCQHAVIPQQTGVALQVDGELFGEAPLEVEPATQPMQMVFPSGDQARPPQTEAPQGPPHPRT